MLPFFVNVQGIEELSFQGSQTVGENAIIGNQYTSHAVIIINGNEDFISQASSEGWDLGGVRDGSFGNPFEISGYSIGPTTGNLVRIENTNLHFVFRNNLLDGNYQSNQLLSFSNVSNANITSNIFQKSSIWNLSLYQLNQSIISNNTIIQYLQTGISIDTVNNLEIVGNEIYGNGSSYRSISGSYVENTKIVDNFIDGNPNEGITLSYSSSTLIRNNVFSNQPTGLRVLFSTHIDVQNNIFSSHNSRAIELLNCLNTNIRENSITNTVNYYAINMQNSNNSILDANQINGNEYGVSDNGKNNTIKFNTISNTLNYALDLSSNLNHILNNNFIFNNNGGIQASDTGLNNLFEKNFWDDWVGPDSDDNGIVDSPYVLNGNNNTDDTPLVTEYLHTMSKPTVLSPNGGETITGVTLIEWEESIDSFDHEISYSVFYSQDAGSTWHLIKSELTSTNHSWNIYPMANGSNYIVNVTAFGLNGLISSDISDAVFSLSVPSHLISKPSISYPSNGQIMDGTIIEWDESIDSYGHELKYSISYSIDVGITWQLLGSDLIVTSFTWNITNLSNETTIQIRVLVQGTEGLTNEDIIEVVYLSMGSQSDHPSSNTISQQTSSLLDDPSNTDPSNIDTGSFMHIFILTSAITIFASIRRKIKD